MPIEFSFSSLLTMSFKMIFVSKNDGSDIAQTLVGFMSTVQFSDSAKFNLKRKKHLRICKGTFIFMIVCFQKNKNRFTKLSESTTTSS